MDANEALAADLPDGVSWRSRLVPPKYCWVTPDQTEVMDKVILSVGGGLVGRKIQKLSDS
jgi:hypothetical protein